MRVLSLVRQGEREPFGRSPSHVVVPESAYRVEPVTDVPTLSTFEGVYTAYRPGMVRLAYVIVGSLEVAEDLTQEAFARLHERWDEVEQPIAFVRTVVTNLCRTEVRRVRTERERRLSLASVGIGDPEVDETWALICGLPFRQRAVLALRYYADLPEAEIATILDCRIGTVKSAHHRALTRLRKELSP